MRKECQPFHLDVLAEHNRSMFDSLIYPENIVSQNMKEIEDFRSDDERWNSEKLYKGYFARKDRTLYWLDGFVRYKGEIVSILDLLPVRVKDTIELTLKQDVVLEVVNPVPFRIRPEKTMTVRELVDDVMPFEHTHPLHFKLVKIIAIMGLAGKIFVCLTSEPSFAKSSIFEVWHTITDRCPVFKPRSIPGTLNKINAVGNMVFDEIHDCKKEVKDIMEEMALQIGGGKPVYINGAMKSALTKNKYDCRNQSLTFLYNNVENYKNPEKEYFEVIFSNNKAIDDRFLKLRFDGVLLEKFDKEFDIVGTAEKNKELYIKIAKQIEFLSLVRRRNAYQRRFKPYRMPKLSNRQLNTYEEITWLIDAYSKSQNEYNELVEVLNQAIEKYRKMVEFFRQTTEITVLTKEEVVEELTPGEDDD